MTRTVMGFVASSLNLATGQARADETRRSGPQRVGRLRAEHTGARGRPDLAPPLQLWRLEDLLPERRRLGRGIDGLIIAGPPSWRRRHSTSSHITEYHTTQPQVGVASFVVPPAVDFDGTAEEFQSGLLRRISEGMPVVEGSTKTGTAGSFRFLSCVMKPSWGAPRHIVVYTARWAGKGQALLFGADCEQLFRDNVVVVHALVQKIVVPGR